MIVHYKKIKFNKSLSGVKNSKYITRLFPDIFILEDFMLSGVILFPCCELSLDAKAGLQAHLQLCSLLRVQYSCD